MPSAKHYMQRAKYILAGEDKTKYWLETAAFNVETGGRTMRVHRLRFHGDTSFRVIYVTAHVLQRSYERLP